MTKYNSRHNTQPVEIKDPVVLDESLLYHFWWLRSHEAESHLCQYVPYTVVPAMNGHTRDQAKVSVHDRWPLVRGTGGQMKDATYNTPQLSPPAIFILNTCIVIIIYAIVIKPKINAT